MKRPLALGGLILLAGCGATQSGTDWVVPEVARGRRNPLQATAASLREGQRLYQHECLICHGESGDGNGPWKDKLPKPAGDFTDRQAMARMTDGEIFWKIGAGREAMPPFGDRLSEQQRWHLVNYVRTFAEGRN
jgi:mono/diheme cytochrome c family protein